MKKVTAAELKARNEAGEDYLLVDVSSAAVYLLMHIPGAINIPMPELVSVFTYLPRDKDIIVYGTHPSKQETAREAADQMRKMGRHAFELEGGIDAWDEAGGEFVSVLTKPE